LEESRSLGAGMFSSRGALWRRILEYGRMIRFSHSVFLLPFAMSAFLLAPKEQFTKGKFILILVALVCARSAAMGFNRILDRDIDALNPRTAMRSLPAGRIGYKEACAFVAASSVGFLASAFFLNELAAMLAPLALGFIFAYSYTKRFTTLSHLWLGIATALAPAGTWVAVTGELEPSILVLVGSVAMWVCGFDILYACQDVEFDRDHGLFSLPARLGIGRALWVARVCHLLSFLGFLWIKELFGLGVIYLCGVGAIGVLFVVEHSLVSEKDLSRINDAFFTVNGVVSVLYFVALVGDLIWG